MESLIPGLLNLLKDSGPWGALLAAGIVGLALTIILVAHYRDLWSGSRTVTQTVGFQDRMLTLIDKLSASEEALRRRIDEIGRDRDAKVEEIEDLRVQMALLRNQRRRLIDMLRKVMPAPPKVRGAA